MRKILLLLIPLLAVLFCRAQDNYFPQKAFSDDGWSGQFKADWYSNELKVLEEPSLLKKANDRSSESYRFLWLRTSLHPIAIRIDLRADGTAILTTKIGNGEAGFPHAKTAQPVQKISRPLTREQTQAFLGRVEKAGFWALPSFLNDRSGPEGSEWVLEAAKKGKYRVVSRWSPKEQEVRDLGLMFALDLAQMKIPQDELY